MTTIKGNSGRVQPLVLHVEDNVADRALMQIDALEVGERLYFSSFDNVESAQNYLFREGKYADRARYPFSALVLLDFQVGPSTGG